MGGENKSNILSKPHFESDLSKKEHLFINHDKYFIANLIKYVILQPEIKKNL